MLFFKQLELYSSSFRPTRLRSAPVSSRPFTTIRLDYCNVRFSIGLPKSTIAGAFAAIEFRMRQLDLSLEPDARSRLPSTSTASLIPIKHRIICKLYQSHASIVHTGRSPAYLHVPTATPNLAPRRSLRSASNQRYEIPRTALKF